MLLQDDVLFDVTRILRVQERVHIRAVLRGEARLRHSFRGGGMCRAALRLCVRNCHASAAASLCIEAGPPLLTSETGEGLPAAAAAASLA